MLPDTKKRDDMDRVADVFLTMKGGEIGSIEIDHRKLVERTVFARRVFGEFEARWGAGEYGEGLNECLWGDFQPVERRQFSLHGFVA